MKYLDFEKIEAVNPAEFREVKPFPYFNPKGLLTDAGYESLLKNMPGISLFEKKFDDQRRGGQEPHNRYSLEYTPEVPLPKPWEGFIAELSSDRYRRALQRLLGAARIRCRMHWHYTPRGCSVSPHVDSRQEYGSQIFYFNSEEEWEPTWGGDTLILDDGGNLDFKTAPALEDFDQEMPACSVGNRSLLFERTNHSWHGVREIACPGNRMRRVFILVAYPNHPIAKIRDRIVGKKAYFV